jgi:hypothetical protein
MKKISILLGISIFISLTSCVNGDDYGTPNLDGECNDLISNKTIQDVAILATSNIQQYSTDDIIEAYVTSSDEGGNFYKSISLVSVDGAKGFSIPIDAYNLYTKYEPGRKVFIKMNSLYFYNNSLTNSLEIGELLDRGEPLEDQVGRLNALTFEDIVVKGCSRIDEETIVNRVSIPTALNDSYLNKLIEFDAVQFSDVNVGKTYYDPNNLAGNATNNIISDNAGNTVALRVSEFATFASNIVPSLNGKIRGVLTKYNGEYQFMIRTLNDINLTNPRFDAYPPLGGTAINYLGSFTENFESYTSGSVTTGQRIFPKYVNDAAVGADYWYVEAFSGNKYLKMSAFSNSTTFQDQLNKVYFIVPVDFTAANSFSFKTQDRFNVGGVLKVYYSTDYTPLGDINAATLVNITSSFTIASGNSGSASQPFVNSGSYNFGSLSGNGFIIFEYTGGYSFSPALTTTMHIDDIVVN